MIIIITHHGIYSHSHSHIRPRLHHPTHRLGNRHHSLLFTTEGIRPCTAKGITAARRTHPTLLTGTPHRPAEFNTDAYGNANRRQWLRWRPLHRRRTLTGTLQRTVEVNTAASPPPTLAGTRDRGQLLRATSSLVFHHRIHRLRKCHHSLPHTAEGIISPALTRESSPPLAACTPDAYGNVAPHSRGNHRRRYNNQLSGQIGMAIRWEWHDDTMTMGNGTMWMAVGRWR